jgi:uncharacterized phosphosugar-binding protein
VPYGDASLEIPGLGGSMGPISSIMGIAVLNSILAMAANALAAWGHRPQLFVSANVESDESNRNLQALFVKTPRSRQ